MKRPVVGKLPLQFLLLSMMNKLQGEHRLYLIKLTANYRSISIIRTSFSIVRPSIHIDIIIDRHYFIYYFHFAFPYFPSLLPCFLLASCSPILYLTNPFDLMLDDRQFYSTNRSRGYIGRV